MGRGLLLWLVGVPIPVIILCGFSFIEPSFREAFRFAEVRCALVWSLPWLVFFASRVPPIRIKRAHRL